MTSKPTLHFAHANGFPAGSYKQLFNALSDDFNVIAIDKLGHNPQFPVDDNWGNVVDELIQYIEQHAHEPIIGVGHSLGSIVTFLAAHKRPELFKQIIMFDPPLAMSYASLTIYIAKKLGFIDKITPAGKTQGRLDHWKDRETAWSYFSSRGLYRSFSDSVLNDYIDAGTNVLEDGSLQLSFSSEVECEIFRTMPHTLEFLKPIAVDCTLVRGAESDVLLPSFAKRFVKKQQVNYKEFPNGKHLFPLAEPEGTAELIKTLTLNK